ncbi:hypothetical protein, partial [Hydrogenibacillus schlegelii]|uniref:hypothetical protein n=1 Tax=Hydrogenibacillus schlegelii TaxID=1484 RepID=UPI0034A06C2C
MFRRWRGFRGRRSRSVIGGRSFRRHVRRAFDRKRDGPVARRSGGRRFGGVLAVLAGIGLSGGVFAGFGR